MPPTIRLRKGDVTSVQYQLMDFDETTGGLVPVDLSSVDDIIWELYWQEHDTETDSIISSLVATATCNILEEETGWVNSDMEFPTGGMYKVFYQVVTGTSIKRYPRYDDQYINAMEQ